MQHGFEKGEVCGRNGCKGIIDEHESETGCSCHINPPCGHCTTPREFCPVCDWHHEEDPTTNYMINGFHTRVSQKTGQYVSWKQRELDKTKIDWHSKSHTNSTMIKEGVYPEGTTKDEVEEKVRGTFGGRFEFFRDGRFKYIAYTD